MINPVQERVYRFQRRYIFAVTLVVVISLPILAWILS